MENMRVLAIFLYRNWVKHIIKRTLSIIPWAELTDEAKEGWLEIAKQLCGTYYVYDEDRELL